MTRERTYALPRPYARVGQYLQAMRLRAGLTQKQVGDALDYSSAQFISNFERGISLPPLAKLRVLIRLYAMEPRTLIDLIMDCERSELRLQLEQKKKA